MLESVCKISKQKKKKAKVERCFIIKLNSDAKQDDILNKVSFRFYIWISESSNFNSQFDYYKS